MANVIDTLISKTTGADRDALYQVACNGAPAQQALARQIFTAVDQVESIERELRDQIDSAQRSLQNALAGLDAGQSLNSLGVLQSTGLRVDLLAARRADAYMNLKGACHAYAAVAGALTDA